MVPLIELSDAKSVPKNVDKGHHLADGLVKKEPVNGDLAKAGEGKTGNLKAMSISHVIGVDGAEME